MREVIAGGLAPSSIQLLCRAEHQQAAGGESRLRGNENAESTVARSLPNIGAFLVLEHFHRSFGTTDSAFKPLPGPQPNLHRPAPNQPRPPALPARRFCQGPPEMGLFTACNQAPATSSAKKVRLSRT